MSNFAKRSRLIDRRSQVLEGRVAKAAKVEISVTDSPSLTVVKESAPELSVVGLAPVLAPLKVGQSMQDARKALDGKGRFDFSPKFGMALVYAVGLFGKEFQGRQYFQEDEFYRVEFNRIETFEGGTSVAGLWAPCEQLNQEAVNTLISTVGAPTKLAEPEALDLAITSRVFFKSDTGLTLEWETSRSRTLDNSTGLPHWVGECQYHLRSVAE